MARLTDAHRKLVGIRDKLRKRNGELSRLLRQAPPSLRSMTRDEHNALSQYEKSLSEVVDDLDNAIRELQRLKRLV